MLGDFNDTAEDLLARRYGHRPVPVPADFGAPDAAVLDYDAPYDDPVVAMAHRHWRARPGYALPRSWLKPGKAAKAAKVPSKKKRLQALKRTVRTSLKLNRCPHALAEWRALAGSQLPGAKKAARQLKRSFTNKCMRIPRK